MKESSKRLKDKLRSNLKVLLTSLIVSLINKIRLRTKTWRTQKKSMTLLLNRRSIKKCKGRFNSTDQVNLTGQKREIVMSLCFQRTPSFMTKIRLLNIMRMSKRTTNLPKKTS